MSIGVRAQGFVLANARLCYNRHCKTDSYTLLQASERDVAIQNLRDKRLEARDKRIVLAKDCNSYNHQSELTLDCAITKDYFNMFKLHQTLITLCPMVFYFSI